MSEAGLDKPGSQRCDLWLFRARFFKSRAAATRFVDAGHVRVDRFGQIQRIERASFAVRPADILIFVIGQTALRLRVEDLADRRGPAREAQALYERLDQTM
ncbi:MULTISPECIES: S4 domain-containing protein [Marinicauda]|mgnify:CR=1 FL=1|uniref:S4 domain-containing protein n=1 Tax=Marinicauda TaxID=1649466 RepID=UPI0022E0FD42|nr:S4 domain-containing protein [Marinicauda sp. Alg238-R41]